jgi:hypothetical protein
MFKLLKIFSKSNRLKIIFFLFLRSIYKMFDYKILLFLIPLVIILFFAYKEINTLKQNLEEINSRLRNHTTDISDNVNQCVDRIEKISKLHISELQNINKIQNQRINRISHVANDSDNETEGLSRPYISPNVFELSDTKPQKQLEKNIQQKEEGVDADRLYLSNGSDSVKIPIYTSNAQLYDDLEASSDDESDCSSSDDEESQYDSDSETTDSQYNENEIKEMEDDEMDSDFMVTRNDLYQTLSKSGFVDNIMSMFSMKEQEYKSHPIIESISDVDSVLEPVVEQVVEQVVDSVLEPVVEPVVDSVLEPVVEPVIESVLEPVVESVLEPVVESVVESVLESVVEPVVESVLEPVVEPVVESVLEPVLEPVVSQTPLNPNSVLKKTLDEYKLEELKFLAKKYKIPVMIKINDKMKIYKKAELYDLLKEIKN